MFLGRCLAFARQLRVFQVSVCFVLGFRYFLFRALFCYFQIMAKDNCVSCGKGVGKTSHALQCARCAGWIHVGCDGIAEEDFAFMKTRMRYGFRWYCQCCLSSRTREGAGADISGDIIKTVTSAMETMHGEIFERMSRIESRLESSGNAGRPVEPTPETFANIVRQTLQESKKKGTESRGSHHSQRFWADQNRTGSASSHCKTKIWRKD